MSPRTLILFFLLSAATTLPARADDTSAASPAQAPSWQTGNDKMDNWYSVTFVDENNEPRSYYVYKPPVPNDQVAPTRYPLYILTDAPDPEIHFSHYTARLSAYSLTEDPNHPFHYFATRDGAQVRSLANIGGSLGNILWDKANPPAWQAGRYGTSTRTNPYPGGWAVAVDEPSTADVESLKPSPMAQYAGTGAPNFNDYYFERPARNPTRLRFGTSDPDKSYRESQSRWGEFHKRVFPIEVLLSQTDPSLTCYATPEACDNGSNAQGPAFQAAGGAAANGNSKISIDLLLASRKQFFIPLAQNIADDQSNKPEFTKEEIAVIDFMTGLADKSQSFYAQLAEARNKSPDALAAFVARWRGMVKAECKAYIAAAGALGRNTVNWQDDLKGLGDLAKQTSQAHSDDLKPDELKALVKADPTALDKYTKDVAAAGPLKIGQVASTYRAIAAAGPTTRPTTQPAAPGGANPGGAPPVELADADLAKLPQADQDAYKKKWDATKTDDQRQALNKKYSDKIAAANPGGSAPPPTPFNPASIKTLADLQLRTPAEQKLFCSALSSGGGAAGNCGDVLANADAAAGKCNSLTGADQTATIKARGDCMANVNACKTQAANPPINSSQLPKDLRDFCSTLLASDPATTNPPGGSKPAATGPPDPCAAAASAAPGANPGDHAGKDQGCKSPDAPPDDKNFQTNLSNGMIGGLAALLIASFFGGPLLMLGAAVIVGVAAYYGSKAINAPPPPDNKKDGGS